MSENVTRLRGSASVAPLPILLAATVGILGCGGGEGKEECYSGDGARYADLIFRKQIDCSDPDAISREEFEQRVAALREQQQAARKRRRERREARKHVAEVRRSLATVCDGIGLPQAASKPTGKLEVVGPVWAPARWRPTRLADAHLVACTSEDDRTVETCRYTDPTPGGVGTFGVARVQKSVSAVIREARNGAQVASKTFLGEDPRECPEEISTSRASGIGNAIVGDVDDWQAVEDWVAQWREK